MSDNSIAILWSNKEHTRNNDVLFPFRQNSNFYYLTGFKEPNAALVLIKGKENKTIFFCEEKNEIKELWEGPILGCKKVKKELGFDDVLNIEEIKENMRELIQNRTNIYCSLEDDFLSPKGNLLGLVNKKEVNPHKIIAIDSIIHQLRLRKSKKEIKLMKKAAQISAASHRWVMRNTYPGDSELKTEAEFQYQCKLLGARELAYPSIVASGNNACTLHYTKNDKIIKNGDLVLIDAGCEVEHYASDITRTFPANGTFSKEQAELYQVVLNAQRKAIATVKPGVEYSQIHKVAVKEITTGLVSLGILKGSVEQNIKNENYKQFFMHGTGHWLGLDVHDPHSYLEGKKSILLKPNMVLTVEPGIYISKKAKNVDKKWKGIGIRIEDDILVTKDGYEILTHAVPKDIADIETLMARL